MISQDAKAKADRYLTLNVNIDLDNIATFLQNTKEWTVNKFKHSFSLNYRQLYVFV